MAKLRAGVIGLGTWGQVHLETYAEHPAVEVAALCDRDASRLQAAGEQCEAAQLHADYRDLLAVEGLDCVSVVTPDHTHVGIVVAALEAGKAVLVEKPLATSLEECDRIGAALKRWGGPLMVDFHNRWNPGVAHIRRELASGRVGRARMIYYRLSDTQSVPTEMLSWAEHSGVEWFLGTHCVDTLRWLLRDEVRRVYALRGEGVLKARGVDTADYFLSLLEFAEGTRAVVENCWILPESRPALVDHQLEVVAEKGALYFDGSPHRLRVLAEGALECPDTFISPRVEGRRVGFATESIRHFVDCVREGRQPAVGFEDGREATRIVLAIEESARCGSPLEL